MSLIIFVLILNGCASNTKEAVQQQGQVEKAVPAVEKPAPAAAATQNVPMSLKFAVSDTTKYKVVMEVGRKVKWEGSVPDKPAFQSGENLSRVEMTFTQKIQSVNSNGNADGGNND